VLASVVGAAVRAAIPRRYDDRRAACCRRRQQLEAAREREQRQAAGETIPLPPGAYFGTVGAVALDQHGHIAVATSTGGMTNKRWGRVGDAPVIGGGTYALDKFNSNKMTGVVDVTSDMLFNT
jgi:isoaspartyl peptidase/L-asparaginase-like protein (Ntn-hydrolase superfamily)